MLAGKVVCWRTLTANLSVVRLVSFPFLLDSLLVFGQCKILEKTFVVLMSALAEAEVKQVDEDWVGRGDGELVIQAPVVAADELF